MIFAVIHLRSCKESQKNRLDAFTLCDCFPITAEVGGVCMSQQFSKTNDSSFTKAKISTNQKSIYLFNS